jgi:hypothetical protein
MHENSATRGPRLTEPVPADLFRYLLDLEIEKAARLRYRVSVVCLTPDVDDVRKAPSLAEHIARVMLHHLRQTDAATVFPAARVGLLLIDADPEALQRIVGRAAGGTTLGSPRFALGGETVSVSGGAGCYPVTGSNASDVLGQACRLMRLAQGRGGDRLLLPPLNRSDLA